MITALLLAASAHTATFHNYHCTQDCSGHEAGYEWAERHNITDPDDCGGRSQSFIEGCQAWAEENGESSDGWSSWNDDDEERIENGDCEDDDEDGECDDDW